MPFAYSDIFVRMVGVFFSTPKTEQRVHTTVHRFRGANGDKARFWNDSQILVDKSNVRKSPHVDRIVETGGYYANECARVCTTHTTYRLTAPRLLDWLRLRPFGTSP